MAFVKAIELGAEHVGGIRTDGVTGPANGKILLAFLCILRGSSSSRCRDNRDGCNQNSHLSLPLPVLMQRTP
jgi:hypothetical protein